MYKTVDTGVDTTGPVTLAQEMPLTPVINQLPVSVGAAPPTVPATVAVKVKVDPRVAVAVEVVTVTIGVILEMTIEKVGVDGPAAR